MSPYHKQSRNAREQGYVKARLGVRRKQQLHALGPAALAGDDERRAPLRPPTLLGQEPCLDEVLKGAFLAPPAGIHHPTVAQHSFAAQTGETKDARPQIVGKLHHGAHGLQAEPRVTAHQDGEHAGGRLPRRPRGRCAVAVMLTACRLRRLSLATRNAEHPAATVGVLTGARPGSLTAEEVRALGRHTAHGREACY